MCQITHSIECPCIMNGTYNFTEMDSAVREYQRLTRELEQDPSYYKHDNFSLVVQPFLEDAHLPFVNGNNGGNVDLAFFAPDCFHWSQIGHSVIARGLWNSMLQPVGKKNRNFNPNNLIDLDCPDSDCPFIRTKNNSEDCTAYFTPPAPTGQTTPSPPKTTPPPTQQPPTTQAKTTVATPATTTNAPMPPSTAAKQTSTNAPPGPLSTASPNTAAPQPPASQTAAPKTAVPQTAAPQTAAPQTAAPQTAAPQTAASQTAAPQTAAPQTAAPSTAGPSTAGPHNGTALQFAARGSLFQNMIVLGDQKEVGSPDVSHSTSHTSSILIGALLIGILATGVATLVYKRRCYGARKELHEDVVTMEHPGITVLSRATFSADVAVEASENTPLLTDGQSVKIY